MSPQSAGDKADPHFPIRRSEGLIDFAGPWEVFQDVMVEGRGQDGMPFKLYTVSDSRAPIRTSGGMQVTPDYTFADAPAPRIVVGERKEESRNRCSTGSGGRPPRARC